LKTPVLRQEQSQSTLFEKEGKGQGHFTTKMHEKRKVFVWAGFRPPAKRKQLNPVGATVLGRPLERHAPNTRAGMETRPYTKF